MSASISSYEPEIQLELEYRASTAAEAVALYKALKPEADSWPRSSTRVRVKVSGLSLSVYIAAASIAEARAALNTVTSWVNAAAMVYGEPN
ncbi:MAG: KEOPS complex subunit Pcc1 [Thermoprotei archaeon]